MLAPMPTLVEIEGTLRSASLRVTRPRVAVLAAVHDHPHADTDTLIGLGARGARRGLPPGRVRRAARADRRRARPPASSRPGRWPATRPGWATTTTTWCAARAASSPTSTAPSARRPASTASDDHGFVIDEAEVVYWGLCPACCHPDRAILTPTIDPRGSPVPDNGHETPSKRDMNTEEDGGCPVAHGRMSHPTEGRRQPATGGPNRSTSRSCASTIPPPTRWVTDFDYAAEFAASTSTQLRADLDAGHDRPRRTGGPPTSATTARSSSGWPGTARAPTASPTAAAAPAPACSASRR